MIDPSLEHLLERLRAKSFGGHCDAYRWLRWRYDVLLAAFEEHRPGWPAIAGQLEAAGVRGAKGQVMTPKLVRKMWVRVCRDVEADRARKLASSDPRSPDESEPPLRHAVARVATAAMDVCHLLLPHQMAALEVGLVAMIAAWPALTLRDVVDTITADPHLLAWAAMAADGRAAVIVAIEETRNRWLDTDTPDLTPKEAAQLIVAALGQTDRSH